MPTNQKRKKNDTKLLLSSDVEDITDVIEITVLDENKRTKSDFLGKVRNFFDLSCMCCNLNYFKVSIPLLNIKNEEKNWYKLKGKSLSKVAKGDSPEILLEIKLFWNQLSLKLRT